MFHVQKISSFDAPELRAYATLRRPLEHWQQGIFVAESEKVVRRLLESKLTVVSVVLPEKWLAEYRPLLTARPENVAVYLAEKPTLETLIGFTMFQGVLAVGKVPPAISLEEILAQSESPKLFVAVDELANAENLGALVRNCVAFGAQALIVGETSSSPYLRRAVRNSMGAIFQLPVVELQQKRGPHESNAELRRREISDDGSRGHSPHQKPTLVETIHELRSRGVRCIAAHPHTDKKNLSQADFTRDCCLVFGSEGNGISQEVLAACDEAVAIPMAANVDSLNVGAAGAVFLYEAARQRDKA
ncbi:MAG TPA: RNA methyltransferase [Verrucomicrobiae bacterium]|nr:RNA methyltransferase [Verrucomicrobiae bacterium]